MNRKYYQKSIFKNVKICMDSYDICQRVKIKRHAFYGELNAFPIFSGPWKEITMDYITDLFPNIGGGRVYNAILIMVDKYTNMVRYLFTNKIITAIQFSNIFYKKIILKYGVFENCVINRGFIFTNAFWFKICYQLRIKRKLNTVFYPQTDGQIEKQNRTLKHYLRVYYYHRQNDSVNFLVIAKFAYQRNYHKTFGYDPFYAMSIWV